MESARSWISAVVVACVLTGSLTWAAKEASPGKGDVVISLVAQKVSVGPDGKETLMVADRAFPGEVVQYDALYRNQGKSPVRELEPTLPIPAGLELIPDTAKPAQKRR